MPIRDATRLQEVSSDTTDSKEELSGNGRSSSGALVGSDSGRSSGGSSGGSLDLAVGDLGNDGSGGGGAGLGSGGGGSGG